MVRSTFHALAAASLALVIAMRLADGSFTALVQTWYEPLLIATVVILIACAAATALPAVRARSSWQTRPGWGGAFTGLAVVVSVVLGLAYRPTPLDSSNLDTGAGPDLAAFSSTAAEDDPARRNIYQWAYTLASQDPADLVGLDVSVVGFVHHPEGAAPSTFQVARFVVACCVADARGYWLPVEWQEAAALPLNAWVRVSGSIRIDAAGLPVVAAASVELVDAPSNPYIYP
jgi:uncharacterized repeat protein (TIGR03943 family)